MKTEPSDTFARSSSFCMNVAEVFDSQIVTCYFRCKIVK